MMKKNRRSIVNSCIAIMLAFGIILSGFPASMIVNRTYVAEATDNYDPTKAVEYAQAHWNDGQGLCAEFVSRCAQAAGCNINVNDYAIDAFEAISNATGVQPQDVILDGDGYATSALDGDRLSAGDVVVQWCYTHGVQPHILLCGGYDSSGYATFYAHNSALNNQRYRLNYNVSYQHTTSCNMGAKVLHFVTDNDSVIKLWGIDATEEINTIQKVWAKRLDDDPNHYAVFYVDDVSITGYLKSDASGFFCG